MILRLAFIGTAGFWVTMNILLWRAEFGQRGAEMPVPPALVWHKIISAPDSSSLTVYHKGKRIGYCEFSTGIGQKMAEMEDAAVPTEELIRRAGHQIRVTGNVSVGEFTNRLRFDCRMQFSGNRDWRELDFKFNLRQAAIEIHSIAAQRKVHLKVTGEEGGLEHDFTLDDLKNPATIIRALAGDSIDTLTGALDLIENLPPAPPQAMEWKACRTRMKVANETLSIYRMETSVLGQALIIESSTLGEPLRLELPGGVTVRADGWSRK